MFKLTVTWLHDNRQEVKKFSTFSELLGHLAKTQSFAIGMVSWTVEPCSDGKDYPENWMSETCPVCQGNVA